MSRTARVLEVLSFFDEHRRHLRAIDVARLLDVSEATAYRCIADLESAGLLERVGTGDYVLGPAIVELDRHIRVGDPLIAAAADVMQSLAERSGGTVLLCRLHGLKVLCVHQVRGRHGPAEMSYERGRPMPLYKGATSKIILAHLGDEMLRTLVARDWASLKRAGLPASYGALSAYLAELRAKKVSTAAGEIDPGAMGWAAAIHQGKQLLGSLSIVISSATPEINIARLSDQVFRAALRIEGRL